MDRTASRQRLVHYLGASSYRRFSGEKGHDVSLSARTWFILSLLIIAGLILLGIWQESHGETNTAGQQPAVASAFRP
jgi:hypothetical protein